MKKFFPFLFSSLLVITVFFATLSIQLIIGYFQDNFDELSNDRENNNNNSNSNSDGNGNGNGNDQYAYYDYLFENITAKTLKGEKLTLNTINSPIIILKFWTSWCPSCLGELPELVELKKKYSDSYVKVISINGDAIFYEKDEHDIKKGIARLTKEYNINFDIILDSKDEIASNGNGRFFEKFKINSIPTTIIFVGGKTQFVHVGELNFNSKKLIAYLDKKLKLLTSTTISLQTKNSSPNYK
ncbi:MAG: TlpA family protein disulfide reductase [Oligoflexia bacterium]|nr:TlpA family protein disulfide reductase [Oligoflexia bacterium]